MRNPLQRLFSWPMTPARGQAPAIALPLPWALAAVAGAWLCVALPVQAQDKPAEPAAAQSVPTVRPEFAEPINGAQTALREGRLPEAQALVDKARALPNLTPYETMVAERTRAAVAQRMGQPRVVKESLEAALLTGQVSSAEETGLVEALVGVSSTDKDNARVVRWAGRYQELKGPNDTISLMRIQAQLATGDERGALQAMSARIAAADQAARPVPEAHQRLLWQLQRKFSDPATEKTLERMALQFPRPEYWTELVALAARRAGDNERTLVELLRLMRAAGGMTDAENRELMAEAALRVGQPGEAQSVVEEAFALGIFGSGPRAAAQQKLLDQTRKLAETDRADRRAAEAAAQSSPDGNALANLGWAAVAALPAKGAPADAEAGLALIEKAIARGGLRRPVEARLHLGMAQAAAGRKPAARATFKSLAEQSAGDPLAEAVRLWALWSTAADPLPPLKP